MMTCACSEKEDPTVPHHFLSTPVPSPPTETPGNETGNNSGTNSNDSGEMDIYFGFLDGEDSSSTYLEMPIESSSTNLIVARCMITKISLDENNDGKKVDYDFHDFKHKDCGKSFLQFNGDGIVFENSYFYDSKVKSCQLYSEIDDYSFITEKRLKIWVYDNIYIVKLNQEELILKYDWNFENSLWGPAQVYYYYQRVLE